MAERITIDGIDYTKSNGRMCYNPEFHENHGLKWSEEDKAYLCFMWKATRPKRTLAMALGRTEATCMSKVYELKKTGKFEYYRKIEEDWIDENHTPST